MLDNITCNGHKNRIDKNFHRSRAKDFFYYARHQTLALDTISQKKSLNTIGRKKTFTRMRGRLFLPSLRLTKDFRERCRDYCIENRLDSDSACAKKFFLNYCDLQETFDNKIETIVSEID